MFQEAAALSEVSQWMQMLKLKESEGKQEEAAILHLLKELLSDELLPDGFALDRIDSDGLWLRDPHGVEMSWREMSDGYRAVLALLVDIVRHLFKTHGIPKSGDAKALLSSTGVVMVDEIDAHLHPSWQREIGPWLRRQFPRVQFLVTTHSPIVCQSADENGLFVLSTANSIDEPRIVSHDEYLKIVMSKPDAILRSAAFGLQNTRSEAAVQKRSRFSKLQAKRQAGVALSPAEQAEVDQLELLLESDE
jgi:predicted ATP-binding protein involved in virulence